MIGCVCIAGVDSIDGVDGVDGVDCIIVLPEALEGNAITCGDTRVAHLLLNFGGNILYG